MAILVDAFPFFNEIELLHLRLSLLHDLVDQFLIVEADATHSGQPKPFNLRGEIGTLNASFGNKIRYLEFPVDLSSLQFKPVTSFDYNSAYFNIEKMQRGAIIELVRQLPDDAFVLISDADEIPSREALKLIRAKSIGRDLTGLQQTLLYYDLTSRVNCTWIGTVATTAKRCKELGIQWHRDVGQGHLTGESKLDLLPDAGWHLSYFGGVRRIVTKIQSTAQQELNIEKFKSHDHILRAMINRQDLYERPSDYNTIGRDFFPQYFLEEVDKNPSFFWNAFAV
jgi:hypothetical protein